MRRDLNQSINLFSMKMNTSLPFFVIILGLLIGFLDGLSSLDGTLRKSCGRELTNRLLSVCDNGFHAMERSPVPESHRRVRRQVVNECCKQACSDATIEQYCSISLKKSTSKENNAIETSLKAWERLKYTEIKVGTVAPEFRNGAASAPIYVPVYNSQKFSD